MKRSILAYIICSLIAFNLSGCGGITISFNSDDKSSSKESKQEQNSDSKSDSSDKTTDDKNKQDKSADNKSDAKDNTAQSESTQKQGTVDESKVTVNINSDSIPKKKEIIYIRDPIPTNTAHGSFIFNNSDCAYLTQSQVSSLTNFELGIARNEIYARHGYIFSLEQFRTYFNAQSWYRPATKDVTLNKIEDYNVNLIKDEEDRRGIVWN